MTAAAYESCPVTRILRGMGDKWSPAVIRVLAEHPHGFNELDRAIEGISRRMLTRTLRSLEDQGFVDRTPQPTHASVPPRVEYTLTPLGHSLREQIRTLALWASAPR